MTTDTAISSLQAKFLEVRIIFQKILGVGLTVLDQDREVWLTTPEDGLVVEFEESLKFYSPDIIYPYPYGKTHIEFYIYEPLEFNISCCGLVGEADKEYDISGVERILDGLVLKKVHDILIPIPRGISDALKEALEAIGVDNNDLWVEDFDTRLYEKDYKYRREHNMPLT